MAHLLVIVARAQPTRYDYLRHVYGGQVVDVIMDRRMDVRRDRRAAVAVDRRRSERRRRDVSGDLETLGWTLVRR
jgi:hypothetical protein